MRLEDVPIDVQNEIIRLHWRKLAAKGGRACMSRTKRSLLGKLKAASNWQIRRLRYGPTGRKPVDVRLASRLAGNAPDLWREGG